MSERADTMQAYRILRTQQSKIVDHHRVTDGGKFRLKHDDPRIWPGTATMHVSLVPQAQYSDPPSPMEGRHRDGMLGAG
jgi:hypothetical protein